jgi:hypothetical protein
MQWRRWTERAGSYFFPSPGLLFLATHYNLSGEEGGGPMSKKLLTLLFMSVLAFPLSTLVVAQEAPAPKKTVKETHLEGIVVRTSQDKSTLTVRKAGSSVEKIVYYDSSTQWVSQEHGSKKVNDIDASQVKDGDRVICRGTWEKNGTFHATLISKRLTPL